jgi:hypothetical protein
MKIGLMCCLAASLFLLTSCQDMMLQNMARDFGLAINQDVLDDTTIIKGLKEALSIGTERAVKVVSQQNGYFGNQLIKVLMPEKMRNVADMLGKVGFQRQVDDFVLSMNRAAERAAPTAVEFFVGAIKEMTFADARQILNGGNTAATEYFKAKTSAKIHHAFQPLVARSLNDVGTTRIYKNMMATYKSIPFTSPTSFDLDQYVTTKAVDGLFTTLGEEEKKIRANPAARTTELLRRVFGSR